MRVESAILTVRVCLQGCELQAGAGGPGVCCEEAAPYQEGQDEEPTTNPNLTKEANLYYNQGDKKPAAPPPPAVSGYAAQAPAPAPAPRPGGYGQGQGQPAPQRPQPAPQPTYQPQPAYSKPTPAPQPSYNQPQPVPQPSYNQPQPAPQPSYNQPQPAPQPSYNKPQPAPQPSYNKPQPAPQPTYQPQPSLYNNPQPAPQPSYNKPQPAPQPSYAPQPPTQPSYAPQPQTQPAPRPTYAPQPPTQPSYAPQPPTQPAPRPTYAPQPPTQPAPRPTYAPQPPTQPSYAPQPQTQPSYAPQPQTQPSYAPQPQTQPSYTPQPPTQPAPQPTYAPQPPQQPTAPQPSYAPQPRPQPAPQPATQPAPQPAPQPTPADDAEPGATPSPVPDTPFNGPRPLPPFPGATAVERTPQQEPAAQQPQPEAQPSQQPQPEPTKPSYGPQQAEEASCGERRQVPRPAGLPEGQAAPGEYPWQAIVANRADNNPICGAAVLSRDAVLTAAHCVHDKEAADLVVIAGEHRMGLAEPGAQQAGVAAVARHPDFNAASLHHDQAVLRLAEPLTLGGSVAAICLPEDQGGANLAAPAPANNCVATGWGLKALKGNHVGSSLNAVPARVMDNTEAERQLRRTFLGPNFQLHRSQVCALATRPATNLCMVDPGGPLACPRPDGRLALAGVYSWDVGCHPSMVSLPEGPMSPTAFSSVDAAWVRGVLAQPVQSLVQAERNEVLRRQQQEKQPEFEKPGFAQGYGK
ncbi:Serine protease 55 [Frankliniella fusca]|uniref:Serine protease 55 n=1 Tax=Frankliniella fusca TaxID=407009 RepID=A0AAE1HWN8_9NEOP|nr:Serine protease 55 [Frankliniella fusca]